MVSATKLKKSHDKSLKVKRYSNKFKGILNNLSSASLKESSVGLYFRQRECSNRNLVLVITSNRGLCGAFNSNVCKRVIKEIGENSANTDILTIGKKGFDLLSKRTNVIDNQSELFNDLTFENVSKVACDVIDKYLNSYYDRVYVVYNRFKNVSTQEVVVNRFLPIEEFNADDQTNGDYIFEPSKIEILEKLIPDFLKIELYSYILDSYSAEQGARMTAMHKATDNANDIKNQLKVTYNKVRQANITGEILEIVSGAEALKTQ
ncbi:ATP synthase subunit gamma [Ichthyobacterium seriolicida]|uniref:ATP synthase subunit gamma n=2 Tax=Ichthyobacterium seriolicida TaxID=242600 RepID=A0A1J1EB58_9FLAO|nr:ATP synthase subunit gamma [Ichthyobacterium seriolicida]